jgi:hypothetical protein
MIKRIFQDLDECILHTMVNSMPNEGEKYLEFILGEDLHTYRTLVRPCAKSLFEYYNSIVGKENVYILTASTREYARHLNSVCEFGLDNDHIYSREDMDQHSISYGYGGKGTLPMSIAHKDNVLIDNLHWRYNAIKTNLIGIREDRYHQTKDYYGINLQNDGFFDDIKSFIEKMLD